MKPPFARHSLTLRTVSLSTIFDVTTWEIWSRYLMVRAMFSLAN